MCKWRSAVTADGFHRGFAAGGSFVLSGVINCQVTLLPNG